MPIEKRGWSWAAIPIDVLLSQTLKDFDIRVYGYVLWRAGTKSKAWPGVDKMATDLHCDEKTIRRSLESLQSDNWIKRCRRFGKSTMTYIFERQEDCKAFVAELHPSAGEVEIIRSGQKSPIRTDVLIGQKSPHDQGKNVLTNRAKMSAGNNSKKNKSKQNINEWMNDDPICVFLRALPGYNPESIEEHRTTIVKNGYSTEALEYLWTFAQDRATALDYDNPVGLFLKMIETYQQSPAYLDLIAERKRIASLGQRPAPVVVPREQPQRIEPDASLTQPLPGHKMTPLEVWQTALGELQLEMTRATFETWVKPTCLLSVNGTWQIGVKNAYAKEWLDNRLMSTIRRVMTGIVGESVTVEFVEVKK